MSFLGGIVNKLADTFLPAAIGAAFPITNLIPGLNNFIADKIGDALGAAVDQAMSQSGAPQFQIKDALNLLKEILGGQKQPCDPGSANEAKDKFGDMVQKAIDDLISDFKDCLKKYKEENANCGKGGKGGKGGAGGANAPIDFRTLVALLAELEQKEAQRLADKVKLAGDALSEAASGKPEDAQKDADIRANQFRATEESKAEAAIFEAVSSMVKKVVEGFGNALKTSAG